MGGTVGICVQVSANSMTLHDTWRLCFHTPQKALKCHFRQLKWRPIQNPESSSQQPAFTALQSCSRRQIRM